MAGQGSARVTLNEIDLSQVRDPEQLPQGVPAAVVGPAKRGPAFVPKTFATIQQFNETFGSLQKVSKDSNANLFGPLALNEWMRNAQAGTFLRVLGVGDGNAKASSGRVTDAGFVVGSNTTYDSNNELQRNPYATSLNVNNEDAALKTARTHFLGCFMKDQGQSTFLQDAGIQASEGPGSIKIRLTNDKRPHDNSTLKLTFINVASLDATDNRTFTFTGDPTANDNVNNASDHIVTVLFDLATLIDTDTTATAAHLNATLVPDTLDAKIENIASDALVPGLRYKVTRVDANDWSACSNAQNWFGDDIANAAVGDEFIATSVGANGKGEVETSQDEANATLTIVSVYNAEATNNNEVEFNIVTNPDTDFADVLVGSKTASVESQEISFGGGGTESAFADIQFAGNPNADDALTITALTNDGDGSFTDNDVVYTFKNDLTNKNDNDKISNGDVVTDTYEVTNAGQVEVKIAENYTDTVLNLKAAFKRVASQAGTGAESGQAAGSGTSTNHEGKLNVSDIDQDSFRIVQVLKGTVGRSKEDGDDPIVNDATNVTILGASDASNTAAPIANGSGHYKEGQDDFASLTVTLLGQPNNDDQITFVVRNSANNGNLTETYVFKPANGNVNANDDGSNNTIVLIGTTLDETLVNLRSAIITNSVAGDKIREGLNTDVNNTYSSSLVLNDEQNSLTIIANAADAQKGAQSNLTQTFGVSDAVTLSNIDGASVVGNFGKKVENFTGGGGSAEPVVRGVLMSPQGVIPTLKTTNAAYDSSPTDENRRKLVVKVNDTDLLDFGTDASTNLIGYQIGNVTTTDDQTFELILNGFKSEENSSSLICSFNPESTNYFAKVMNTDPEKIEERGHYLHAHWDIDPRVAKADLSGVLSQAGSLITSDMAGFCMHSVGDRAVEGVVGGVDVPNTPDFESFDSRYRTAKSPWIMSQKSGGSSKKLFRLHSLDDGKSGNDRFRILISNIRSGENASDFGIFDLTLESFDSDPISGEKLIQWSSLSLDPESKNYIGRVIGDKHMYYDFDRLQSKQRLVEEGDYEVRNKYVRVEVSVELETADGASWARSALPCGFKEYKTLNLSPRAGLFAELGTDREGAGRLLPAGSFNSLKVLPLPFVKHITRKSGLTTETSEALAWGVKFAKKQRDEPHREIGEIRFNPSIISWTKFFPDMGAYPVSVDSQEEFSLENIAWNESDWSTSEYVRSGNVSDLPSGKQYLELASAASSGRNVRFLKFRCIMQGGFDGLNIFNKEKAAMSSIAAFREANEEVADSNVFTGPTIVAYQRAVDVLADKSATEFQLLAIPGIREPVVTDYAITACESRFDAMLVMDIEEYSRLNAVILDDTKPSVSKTISKFSDRRLDTSFAAAYFPDVIIPRPSNGSPLQVPPSVGMLGVMSLNDTLADPWFAPAGLRRGRIRAQNVKVQMNRDTLNDLYDADINPIYEPAGRSGQVFAFGQKTLLQNQSALDRINVRRLLINIRRKVKAVANTLLFEPNRASTLAKFNALVDPIMSEVKARQGVERYKVQIDTTTTTENDVLNNTIRGKIYLQPTKSVEFISLDFVVTNSID